MRLNEMRYYRGNKANVSLLGFSIPSHIRIEHLLAHTKSRNASTVRLLASPTILASEPGCGAIGYGQASVTILSIIINQLQPVTRLALGGTLASQSPLG